jgi:hypothetical protein
MGRRGGGRSRGGGGGGLFGGGKGGGFFGKKKAPAQSRSKTTMPARAPKKQNQPAPMQQRQGGGLGDTLKQGMAFGAGSAIMHTVIGGAGRMLTGGGGSEEGNEGVQEQAAAQVDQFEGKACGINQKRLYACLNKNDGDAAACQYFFDSLRECQDNLKYQNGHQ